MTWKEKLFTRKSGIRHLIMLGITILVSIWTYVFLALQQRNWKWIATSVNANSFTDYLFCIEVLFVLIGIASCLSIIIYWNAVKWMCPFLIKGIISLLSAIPLVNLLVPAIFRNKISDDITDLVAGDDENGYYDEDGYWNDGSIPFIIAVPLAIITNFVRGIVKFNFYWICGIGIPVFSPVIMVLGIAGISALLEVSKIALLPISIVAIAFSVCLHIIHPVMALKSE